MYIFNTTVAIKIGLLLNLPPSYHLVIPLYIGYTLSVSEKSKQLHSYIFVNLFTEHFFFTMPATYNDEVILSLLSFFEKMFKGMYI